MKARLSILILILVVIFLTPLSTISQTVQGNPKVFSATGQVLPAANPYKLLGITIELDGTNSATITAYHGTGTDGRKLFGDWYAYTDANNKIAWWVPASNVPQKINQGLYIVVTCAGTIEGYVHIGP